MVATALLSFLLLGSSNAFSPNPNISPLLNKKQLLTSMSAERPTGSFFNQVPDKGDDGNQDGDQNQGGDSNGAAPKDPFEKSMEDLIRNRNTKPIASSPSTLGGVPTAKATGFGNQAAAPKIIKTSKTNGKKSFVGIGKPDKPINDVNKPEYDDQGYTLYANEETGEKSRVFEALVEYPSIFKMKIIGRNESTFASDMVQIVADSCSVTTSEVKYSERANGKWLSVTVHAPVESADMLYALYENVDRDPRVKFKF